MTLQRERANIARDRRSIIYCIFSSPKTVFKDITNIYINIYHVGNVSKNKFKETHMQIHLMKSTNSKQTKKNVETDLIGR